MSAREQIQDRLVAFAKANHLAEVYGGDYGLGPGNKYRYVLMAKARTLDLAVNIYGPKFIQVKYQTMYHNVPHRDSVVFENVENVERFLKLAFVEFSDEAMEVPRKK